MNKRATAVLFDMDGTLIDSTYLHTVTWWETFRQAGHEVAMARIHRAIGMGADHLLTELLPPDRATEEDTDLRAAHGVLYATCWSRLRPFPGAADLLRACKNRGLRVVLASSADEPEFNAMRAALDADDAIDDMTNSADVSRSKPAPDLVEMALDKAGVPAAEAVFVGDATWDALACGKAGVRCIALLSGGISAEELTSAGAAQIYRDPAELLAGLSDSLLGRTAHGNSSA